MLSPITLLILVIATVSLAAPLTGLKHETAISARANVPEGVICLSRTPWSHSFTQNVILDASNNLVHYMNVADNDPQKPSSNTGIIFPHPFHTNVRTLSPKVLEALDADRACRTGQPGTTYLEYPMASCRTASASWTGGNPDADRVLVMGRGNGVGHYHTPVYCLSMHHEPRPSPHMAPCTTSTESNSPH